MANTDSLGDRIKNNYENRAKTYLTRRMPCMIRLDGCHFHTFTKGFDKPFDRAFMETMWETTLQLCKSIQGCVFGYTQSDEITLVLTDYKSLQSEAWYDYQVQKMASVSASLATMYFNRIFVGKCTDFISYCTLDDIGSKIIDAHSKAIQRGATFDARCFSIPKEEVTNAIIWRIMDAERNSINSLGQAYFTHKQLQGKKGNEIQDMLFTQYGVNWNDLEIPKKRGVAVVRNKEGTWIIDTEMPRIITNRDYVESRINFEEEI